MSALVKSTIAVCGVGGREMDEMVSAVARSSQLQAIVVRWPDRAALDAAGAIPAAGWLLLASGAPHTELAREIGARSEGTPLIVVGGASAPATATCWLPRRPSDEVLTCVLVQLVNPTSSVRPALAALAPPPASEPPPSRSWRRKSDMIIGVSPAITQLLAALDRLAPSVAPVLVTGESGTGKELVARALHYTGPRRGAPFVAINCGAIPENLFEAELFGYQRGAFTGAVSSRPGAFEAADGGTLFLDEIGEMPLHMQVKMLRVLETGEVTRLGSNESRRCNVRVLAATNRKLEAEVRAGRFREDLFYRVSVCPITIPPLRDRPEDIPPLATHHLEQIARREQRPPARLTAAALEKLLSHRWPGNVRELANVLERAVLLAEQGAIDTAHLLLPEDAAPLIPPYREAKERFEHGYYTNVMRTTGGNVSLAAKLAQKTRKEVYDALRRLGLEADVYRESSGNMPVARAATPGSGGESEETILSGAAVTRGGESRRG